MESEEHLVELKHVIITVEDKVFDYYIRLAAVGEGVAGA
jgi:hypothetical protein